MKQLAVIAVLAVALVGCEKKDSTTVGDKLNDAANKTADAANKTADAAKDAAKDASATVDAQAQIDKVKTLVTENKPTEAKAILDSLSALKLTPEQQKVVDDLKEQVKKLTAGK